MKNVIDQIVRQLNRARVLLFQIFNQRSLAILSLLIVNMVYPHEPIFGLGPGTIFKGGYGVELEVEGSKTAGEKTEQELHEEIIYGINQDISLTIATSTVLSHNGSTGLGDSALRIKHRFWRNDMFGAQDSAAYLFGVKLPTGNKDRGLGTGSVDFLIGVNAGHEARKWYYFGDLHYLLRTNGLVDTFFLNGAWGIRPWDTGYLSSDWVFYLELNYEQAVLSSRDGRHTFFLSPSYFITYRNWSFRGGWQFPILQKVAGGAQKVDQRFAFSVEGHF